MRIVRNAMRWARLGYHLAVARIQSGISHQYQKATISELERVDKARKRIDQKRRLAEAQALERKGSKYTDRAAKHWQEAQRLAYKLDAPPRVKHIIHRHGIRLGKRNLVTHAAVKEWSKSVK